MFHELNQRHLRCGVSACKTFGVVFATHAHVPRLFIYFGFLFLPLPRVSLPVSTSYLCVCFFRLRFFTRRRSTTALCMGFFDLRLRHFIYPTLGQTKANNAKTTTTLTKKEKKFNRQVCTSVVAEHLTSRK